MDTNLTAHEFHVFDPWAGNSYVVDGREVAYYVTPAQARRLLAGSTVKVKLPLSGAVKITRVPWGVND